MLRIASHAGHDIHFWRKFEVRFLVQKHTASELYNQTFASGSSQRKPTEETYRRNRQKRLVEESRLGFLKEDHRTDS